MIDLAILLDDLQPVLLALFGHRDAHFLKLQNPLCEDLKLEHIGPLVVELEVILLLARVPFQQGLRSSIELRELVEEVGDGHHFRQLYLGCDFFGEREDGPTLGAQHIEVDLMFQNLQR